MAGRYVGGWVGRLGGRVAGLMVLSAEGMGGEEGRGCNVDTTCNLYQHSRQAATPSPHQPLRHTVVVLVLVVLVL